LHGDQRFATDVERRLRGGAHESRKKLNIKSNMKIRHPETADVDLDDMETTTAATKADGVLAFVRSVSEVDENASEIVKAPSHRFAQEKIYAKTDRV
jgi:hypothetical protein